MNFFKIYTFFLLIIGTLLAQNWSPFHIEELIKNRDIEIDFEDIDNQARLEPLPTLNRVNLTHEIIGYLPYWEYADYIDLDYDLLTQINYFSVELDAYGNILNDHNWTDLYLITYAHQRNVKVKLCATLFGQNELTILLSNSINRQNAINNLLELVLIQNADGIDIDFELLPMSQRENLVIFMQELSDAFHQSMEDPIITLATPAVDWNDAWDYNSLAQITDGLFIMGYNYFYSGSSSAGPVSPLGGYFYDIEYSVNDYIQKTNNQLDKIILGLPYYGYDWPVMNNLINSFTTGLGNALTYDLAHNMSQNHGYNWNDNSKSAWISYQDDLEWRQCWYDDSLSLSHKYQFAIDNEVAGIGIWALGYDNNHNELWGALYDKFIYSLFGDINMDGIINVVDIVFVVNMILGLESTNLLADINNDAEVNVLDIIEIIFLILN